MHRLLTTVSCLVAATAAFAEPVRLRTEALRTAFTGALVEMDTPTGTVIPVRFTKDGLVSGKAGALAPVLGAARDRGRWWTANDQLCVKWFRWFEAKTRCVSIQLEGTRISWRGEEDRSGTGTIVEPAPVVAAVAPTPPAPVKPAKIELADTGPVPKPGPAQAEATAAETPSAEAAVSETPSTGAAVAETPSAEAAGIEVAGAAMPNEPRADTPAKALPIRFAAAALGAMSFMPPLVREPSHLLDGPARQVNAPDPVRKAAESEPLPVPTQPAFEETVAAARPADPPAKAAETATGYASSTVILASFRVAGVDEDDILNVRSGPSAQYASVGGLPPEGRGVKIVGPCRDDWCPIKHGRLSGWVNRTFLAEESSGPTATALSR